MQESRASSTLELVVNEQQLQNMSQIDLRPNDGHNQPFNHQATSQNSNDVFCFGDLKNWPARFRDTFSAKLDEAKSKSDSKASYAYEIIKAFSGAVIWTLCFLLTIIVPLFLSIIGLINLDSCNDRPALPYLIFAVGFVMTGSNLFNLAMTINLPILTNHEILTNETKNIIASMMNILLNFVVAFLYIISAYMVFTIDKYRQTSPSIVNNINNNTNNNNDEGFAISNLDCDQTLYRFSFWFITLTLGTFVIFCLIGTILFAYNRYRLAIFRGSTPRSQTEAGQTNGAFSINRV